MARKKGLRDSTHKVKAYKSRHAAIETCMYNEERGFAHGPDASLARYLSDRPVREKTES